MSVDDIFMDAVLGIDAVVIVDEWVIINAVVVVFDLTRCLSMVAM